MGTNTVTTIPNSDPMRSADVNQLIDAIKQALVGRNASGVPQGGQQLGTASFPWGTARITSLVLNGQVVDLSGLVGNPNRLLSGQTRLTSNFPDFIRANGAAAQADIEAAATDLVLTINGTAVTITSDINIPALTLAPAAGNTCSVNDTSLAGSNATKYQGEDGTVITIDAAGVEITNRIGQYAAFKNGATDEIFIALIKSSTELTNVLRGFYLDASGSELRRETLSNNDVLTIHSLGWVFIEDDGATVDVSYTTPVYDFNTPGSPATGDYWFDLQTQEWKRYDGVTFVLVNRILIGQVVIDTANCIASRCVDFTNAFSEQNNIDVELKSTEIVETKDSNTKVSVYGSEISSDFNKVEWNITTDLEFGIEAINTTYYLYISDEGERVISEERPHNRPDLKGFYHPFKSMRCVGLVFNDASNDFDFASAVTFNDSILAQRGTAKAWLRYAGVTNIISGSYNISSVTDLGTGFYEIFYDTEFESADTNSITGSAGTLEQVGFAGGGPVSTQVTSRIASTGVLNDTSTLYFIAFGDTKK